MHCSGSTIGNNLYYAQRLNAKCVIFVQSLINQSMQTQESILGTNAVQTFVVISLEIFNGIIDSCSCTEPNLANSASNSKLAR